MNLRSTTPAIVAAVLVLLSGALYLAGDRESYVWLLSGLGAAPFSFPFLDTHAVMSAVQCHRLGIDVFATNPCDVFGRIHVYSPLWLSLSVLPMTVAWTPVAGLVLIVVFLLSLLLLPAGRGWRQVGVITLATISGSVAFALERANTDLVVFVLAVAVIRLVRLRLALRLIGYGLAVLAALLKFYPAVLLLTAARERLGIFLTIGIAAVVTISAFALSDLRDVLRVLASIPTTSYFDAYAFGARDLPFGLAETFGWSKDVASILFALLVCGVFGIALRTSLRGTLADDLAALTDAEATSLMVGCVLVLACFFTAQNTLYRGVHFLFVMPALTALAFAPGTRQSHRLPITGMVLILLLMDWEPMRRHINPALLRAGLPEGYVPLVTFHLWLWREVIWWSVISILASLLLCLLARIRAWQDLRGLRRFSWHNRPFRAQERHMRRAIPFLVAFLVTAAVAHAAPPTPTPSTFCETAIASAEAVAHLPPRLLGAIANVESGRPDDHGVTRPWPWTIDVEGRGQFFDTKADAIAAVSALQASGVRSIDIGCMQVNLMYHPDAFASLDEAFDPSANAQYAARFLNALYGASGSWVQATAAYHSETPAIGADYQRRVMARWQPNMYGASPAYRMFGSPGSSYADFAPVSRAYGDFASQAAALPARMAGR